MGRTSTASMPSARRRLVAVALVGALLIPATVATVAVQRADAADGRVLTVLLLGSDAGPPRSGDPLRGRADGFQLLFVSADRQHASILSVPRDSWVPVAGRGNNRINACLTAGPETCVRTVEALWDLQVDGWVVTSMWGFAEAVDAFGGLVIDVTRPVSDGGQNITSTGRQGVNGYQALTWGRDRRSRPGGDFTRSRAQGEMLAVGQAHLYADGSTEAAQRVASIIRQHGATSFSSAELAAYALQALRLPPGNVRLVGLPGSPGWAGPASVVYLDASARAIVADAAADGIVTAPERIGVGPRDPVAPGVITSTGPLSATTSGRTSGVAVPAVPTTDLALTDPWQRGPAVRRLQTFLNGQADRLRFDRVTVDGVYGPMTREAVIDFQVRTGRTPNGVFSLKLWADLIGD